MELPQFFALHTTYKEISKYVRYINEDVPHRGFLSISGLDVVSPFTRFEVVESKSSRDAGLVNIRCCYNHKYWVKSEDSSKIVAGADEPEEDQSKLSCTLFKPIYNGDKIVKFLHANLKYYVYIEVAAHPKESWLYLKKEMPGTPSCEFIVTDLVSMMILPKYVVLKGNDNTVLRPGKIDNGPLFIKFAVDDITIPTAMMEVRTTHDGSISLNNLYLNMIWKRNSENWILVHPDNGQPIDTNMLFWPTKVKINVVALCNLGNNRFCKRMNDITNRLSPVDPNISNLAHINVEEPVTSRRIDNLKYFLCDCWIYNRTASVVIATETVENDTQDPMKRVVKFYIEDTRSLCWNSSASLKLESVPTTLDTAIPFIDDNGNIIVPDGCHISFAYKWGETITSKTTKEKVNEVTVKPMSKMTVNLIATQASYDVPFSYSQLDTVDNGMKIPYSMEDGVYTGTNRYNYRFETQEQNL